MFGCSFLCFSGAAGREGAEATAEPGFQFAQEAVAAQRPAGMRPHAEPLHLGVTEGNTRDSHLFFLLSFVFGCSFLCFSGAAGREGAEAAAEPGFQFAQEAVAAQRPAGMRPHAEPLHLGVTEPFG